MRMKLFCTFTTVLIFSILNSACTQETTSNTDQRERDRQNEKTGLISDEYAKAAGVYTGEVDSGAVRLEVKTAWTHDPSGSGAASTTPQPILVGVLSIYPDLEISGSQPLEVGLPIDGGTYSDQTKTMTLVFTGSASTSRLVCDLSDVTQVKCQWFTGVRVSSLNLVKVDPATSSSKVSQHAGTYTGQTSEFNISANFQTTYVSPGSGQGVRAVILARFGFSDRESKVRDHSGARVVNTFTSQNGAYDPQTDTLSFTISGDTPILVTCKRISRANLSCQWNSNHYLEFGLTAETEAQSD